jgi:hypothetical protein
MGLQRVISFSPRKWSSYNQKRVFKFAVLSDSVAGEPVIDENQFVLAPERLEDRLFPLLKVKQFSANITVNGIQIVSLLKCGND